LLGSVLPSAYATHGPDLSLTSIIRNLPALDVSGIRAHYQEKTIAVPIFYLLAAHRRACSPSLTPESATTLPCAAQHRACTSLISASSATSPARIAT